MQACAEGVFRVAEPWERGSIGTRGGGLCPVQHAQQYTI